MHSRTKNKAGQLFTYEISFVYFLHRNSGRRMKIRFENAILYDKHGVEVIRAHQRDSSYYFF